MRKKISNLSLKHLVAVRIMMDYPMICCSSTPMKIKKHAKCEAECERDFFPILSNFNS